MNKMRLADPVYVQYIWDALETSADGTVTFDAIYDFILREKDLKCNRLELEKQLNNALHDKCIGKSGSQYSKVDISPISTSSDHDLYCFQCHRPGTVVACPTCFRVFHQSCLPQKLNTKEFVVFPDEVYEKKSSDTDLPPSSPCSVCKRLSYTNLDKATTPGDMRSIYSSVVERMKTKAPWRTLNIVGYFYESERNQYFIFKQINTRVITEKLQSGSLSRDGYKNRTQILVDLDLLIHNVAIIYGLKSEMTSTVLHVQSLLIKELCESAYCVDCYIRSKKRKHDSGRITEACRKPHKLIWFHHSKFSFRLCKVLHEAADGYEVICFDGRRERLFVPLLSAVQTTFTATELGLRMTADLKRALDEAQLYSENQRRRTPSFVPTEGIRHASTLDASPSKPYSELPVKTESSSKTGLKRPRTPKKLESTKKMKFTQMSDTDTKRSVSQNKTNIIFAESSASSCDTFRPVNRDQKRHDISGTYFHNSNGDSSSLSSSTNSSSNRDRSHTKFPNSRSVIVPPVGTKCSNPLISTSAALANSFAAPQSPKKTATFPSAKRSSHSLGKAAATDGCSDPKSSAPETSSFLSSYKIPRLNLFRPLNVGCNDSNNATVDDSSPLERYCPERSPKTFHSSKDLNSRNSRVQKPKTSSSNSSIYQSSKKSTKERKDLTKVKSVINGVQVEENITVASKTIDVKASFNDKRGKKMGEIFSGSTRGAPATNLTVGSNSFRPKIPPLCPNEARSTSSVSPAALSSSSGIGSSVNGADGSPVDLVINGQAGSLHTDQTQIGMSEERVQMKKSIESLTLERDKALYRITQLESEIRTLQEAHRAEITEAKSKSWCVFCLELAVYHCCKSVAYCSKECQHKDWKGGHYEICENNSPDSI